MRRTGVAGLLTASLLVTPWCTTTAIAQGGPPKSGNATDRGPIDPDKPGGPQYKAEKKRAAKSASGTVKSASADCLVVGGKMKGKDEEWTFCVDSKTAIRKGGKAITAEDVKAGDSVQIRYTEDSGKAMAQSVTVKSAPAKKAEKMERTDKMDARPAEKK